jgi:hypothetical protein
MATLNLKSILVPSKTVEVPFPGYEGFTVSLSFLSREALINVRKKATKQTFKGRQIQEELNDELFLQLYASAAIKGWKGLKMAFVEQLAPVDMTGINPDEELPFTEENAFFLMKNSSSFDNWVSDTVTDLGNFQMSKDKK